MFRLICVCASFYHIQNSKEKPTLSIHPSFLLFSLPFRRSIHFLSSAALYCTIFTKERFSTQSSAAVSKYSDGISVCSLLCIVSAKPLQSILIMAHILPHFHNMCKCRLESSIKFLSVCMKKIFFPFNSHREK